MPLIVLITVDRVIRGHLTMNAQIVRHGDIGELHLIDPNGNTRDEFGPVSTRRNERSVLTKMITWIINDEAMPDWIGLISRGETDEQTRVSLTRRDLRGISDGEE